MLQPAALFDLFEQLELCCVILRRWVAGRQDVDRDTGILGIALPSVPRIGSFAVFERARCLFGPLFPELADILPDAFASRIKRGGTVDCMADPNFAAAVKATGRKKLIMAGLLTEVCVLYPALSAVEDGYEVQVIADASGSGTKAGDDIAIARMQLAGAHVASTIQILSETVDDWSTGAGPEILGVLGEIYASLAEDSAA